MDRGFIRFAFYKGKEQHLYLLFDDWPRGYSIRKVNLSSNVFGSGKPPSWQMAARVSGGWEMVCTGDRRLPPAIFRFEAQRGLPMYFAAAFDSKILALQPTAPGTAMALASVLEHHFAVRTRSCLFAQLPLGRSRPGPIPSTSPPAACSLLSLTALSIRLARPAVAAWHAGLRRGGQGVVVV